MPNLSWYVNRLSRMSPGEVAYRLSGVVRATGERVVVPVPRVTVPRHPANEGAAIFIQAPAGMDSAPYAGAADRILAGQYTIFDLDPCAVGAAPQWNRDPLTGRMAPLSAARSLDYRDERQVGNIKYLWEPNRHLHLVTLAQAYALTKDLRYAREVERQISSWIEQCPYGRGPNWASSLELGIRLINWSLAWQLLGGEGAPLLAGAYGRAFRESWLCSVVQHAQAIRNNLSRFSSANNHLIGETAGIWIASVTWPYWPQLRHWGRRCKDILEQQALTQNAADGGNREQAFSYQQFVLDFLLLAGLAARSAGEDFAPVYWQRIEKMLEFLASMMDVAGHVPMIGDADDGYAVKLSQDPGFCCYRSLLATGAVLFEREDFMLKAGKLDAKTQWMTGGPSSKQGGNTSREQGAAGQPAMLARSASSQGLSQAATSHFHGTLPVRSFSQSGYYLLGGDFNTEREIRLLIDAGPLGYLSLAAHGHADALSLLLNVGGREILIDPGTYAYHTEPDWRRYFRSTAAHNTVVVDDQDQSRQSGNFMWSRHAAAHCLEFSQGAGVQHFAGEHDGYSHLSDGVIHRREVLYQEAQRWFEVSDTLQCAGPHAISRRWHFAEDLEPLVYGKVIEVHAGRFTVTFTAMDPPERVRSFRGGSPLEGGWVSRRFGHKDPCTTVAWDSGVDRPTTLCTRIEITETAGP